MKQTDIAWAAGFFDGEGCIQLQGKCATLAIAQKDGEPLARFQKIFGMGKISYRDIITPKGKKSYVHTYTVSGLSAVLVLSLMLSYLTVKQSKAIKAINLRPKLERKRHLRDATKLSQGIETERLAEIYMLHNKGQTFSTIGKMLGISRQRVHQLYRVAFVQHNLNNQFELAV